MQGFVSHYPLRLDAKGRISIPAVFRGVLARDGFEGLYCFPSPQLQAVDAGGNGLVAEIERRLAGFRPLTADYDMVATALYGASEILKIDAEGRVTLTDSIKAHAGITDSLVVVGLGHKFQFWEPARFEVHRAESRRRALAVLEGNAGGAA